MRIGIITDIHEDIERLKITFSKLEKKQVDEVVCLGDITGFTPPYYNYFNTRNARKCTAMIKNNCSIVLAGNHDHYAIHKLPVHNANFNFPKNWYELDYHERKNLANGNLWLYEHDSLSPLLTKAEKSYFETLPEFYISKYQDINILFSHFIYPDFTGIRTDFNMEPESFSNHFEFMKKHNCQISFSGHVHAEGFGIGTFYDFRVRPFGKFKLQKRKQSILCPNIAKGVQSNGFIIFDTDTFVIEAIPLKSKKHKVKISN